MHLVRIVHLQLYQLHIQKIDLQYGLSLDLRDLC